MGTGGKAKAAEKLPCPECGRLLSNRGAWTLHRRYQHGVGLPSGPRAAEHPERLPGEGPARAANEILAAAVREQSDGRARMEERSVPLWQLELERERQRREKLEEQLKALGQSLETLTQGLPAVRQVADIAAKGQEQVLARIEALDKAVAGVGTELKEVTGLKAELKSLCDLYPDLCKVVEDRKKAPEPPSPPAPEAPPAPAKAGHPLSPAAGQTISVAEGIEFLKHWTKCPECVERLRPQLEQDPALLDEFLAVYRPKPKEEPGGKRGFVG
mgnify:FL=1